MDDLCEKLLSAVSYPIDLEYCLSRSFLKSNEKWPQSQTNMFARTFLLPHKMHSAKCITKTYLRFRHAERKQPNLWRTFKGICQLILRTTSLFFFSCSVLLSRERIITEHLRNFFSNASSSWEHKTNLRWENYFYIGRRDSLMEQVTKWIETVKTHLFALLNLWKKKQTSFVALTNLWHTHKWDSFVFELIDEMKWLHLSYHFFFSDENLADHISQHGFSSEKTIPCNSEKKKTILVGSKAVWMPVKCKVIHKVQISLSHLCFKVFFLWKSSFC